MFVYFINYFNWSDSVYYPVFHKDEFSVEDFNKMCINASDKAVKKLKGHNKDIHLGYKGISKYDVLDNIVNILCEEYGFIELEVLGYDIEEQIVDVHKRF